jgi:alpha-mannosidase
LTAQTNGLDIQQSFFSIDNPALVLDTVKKAEDSDGIILRFYESRGTRGTAQLTSSLPVTSAAIVNLLEDELQPLNWHGGATLEFKPFEIITICLWINQINNGQIAEQP